MMTIRQQLNLRLQPAKKQRVNTLRVAISLLVNLVLSVLAICICQNGAFARDQIQISGSSTVFPYAKIVAETFSEVYPKYRIPVIESGGSGAGIKEFCRGLGTNTIDIANASRAISHAELKSCFQSGVLDVEEIRFGYDGIVFASDIHGPDWPLTTGAIYKALAAKLVIDGHLRDNPFKTWQDIDGGLPPFLIMAFIPGEKHGTREVFEDKVMMVGCAATGALQKLQNMGLDQQAIHDACVAIRKDGNAVDIDGDYSETLARISANKTALGVFGLDYYQNNADRLKLAPVDGVIPSAATIASGKYPVSRPLYFYVKKAHIGVIPGLARYVGFFLSDQMIGPDSPLVDYGLVAAPQKEREAQRAAFERGDIMSEN